MPCLLSPYDKMVVIKVISIIHCVEERNTDFRFLLCLSEMFGFTQNFHRMFDVYHEPYSVSVEVKYSLLLVT